MQINMQIIMPCQPVPFVLDAQENRHAKDGLSSGRDARASLNPGFIDQYISPKTECLEENNVLPHVPQYELFEERALASTKTRSIPKESPEDQLGNLPASSGDTSLRNPQLLKIADDKKVEQYLASCLVNMQQPACKLLFKTLIKIIQPRKQNYDPYFSRSRTTPAWWPSLPDAARRAGTQRRYVRHVEPGRLTRPERMRLILHLLQLLATPSQNRTVILENEANVALAHYMANEDMSFWFNASEENRSKRYLMNKLFIVLQSVERYNNGEIDDTAHIAIDSDDIDPFSENTFRLQSTNESLHGKARMVQFHDGLHLRNRQQLHDGQQFRDGEPILCDRCHDLIFKANTLDHHDFQIAPA